MRRSLGLAVSVLALAATIELAGPPGHATAACITGATEQVTVTGDVVSTSVSTDGLGLFAQVRQDDGTVTEVYFWGRNPTRTIPGGAENTVEDAWPGTLPEEGGRYAITGAPEGQGLTVSLCATGADVRELVPPPVTGSGPASSILTDDADSNSSVPVVVFVVIGGALLAAIAIMLTRRGGPVR